MKKFMEMSVEELIAEMNKQYGIAFDAKCKARKFQEMAIQKFLKENYLDGIVRHKKTNTKGVLRITYDSRGCIR